MALITEDHLEQQCLEWFKELGRLWKTQGIRARIGA